MLLFSLGMREAQLNHLHKFIKVSVIIICISNFSFSAEKSNQEVQALSPCPVKEMIRLDRGEDAVVVTPPRDQGSAYNCFAQTASCLTESWMWKHRDKKNKNIKIEDLEMSATTSTIDGLLYGVNRDANITKQDELHKFNVSGGGSVCDVVNAVSKRGSYCPRSANIYESKIKSGDEKSPDNDSKNYQKTVLDFIQNILNVHKNLTNASADTNDEFSAKRAEEARKTLSMLKNMYIQLVEEIAKGKTETEIKIQLKKELERINSSHQCADCAISNQSEKTLISQVDSLIKVSEQLKGDGDTSDIFKNFIRTMAEKDPYYALPELIRAISAPSCLDQKNEIKINPKPFWSSFLSCSKNPLIVHFGLKRADGRKKPVVSFFFFQRKR